VETVKNKYLLMAIGVVALYLATPVTHAEDWLPIDPAELKMTTEPKAPAASAIYLYRQVDRDDNGPMETVYARIKILTEEGRKYADVQIAYDKEHESIRGIDARTIRPDGSIAKFDGTIFEKPIVQGRGVRLLAKTFTLPEVQVGSIIEYRYRHFFRSGYVYDSHWILSEDLFTKHAKFSFIPYPEFGLSFSWPVGLPVGTEPPKKEYGKVRLESRDVPAFVHEEYMPPENELKFRVDFVYSETTPEKDPVKFWQSYGKAEFHKVDRFIDRRRVMEQAVAQIVDASDSPETKLRKIYARAQQIRNTSFERDKTDQELKREKQKDADNVADVWSRGYGTDTEINFLFLALARAAGFAADAVLVSTRNAYFFNKGMMNSGHLNSNVVLVKLNGQEVYCDPGTALAPMGLLPWPETGVAGLQLDKNGGTWVTTPSPKSINSRTERKAILHLTTSGALEGKVTVRYTGLEALWRRLEERHEDAADRKQFLERDLAGDIPTGADVVLTNSPDWTSPELPLVAEFDLKIPGWAAAAGQRALLPVGVFSNGQKGVFKHAARTHHLYFNFPARIADDIAIELPPGWQVNNTPKPQNADLNVATFSSAVDAKDSVLHIKRDLIIEMIFLDKKYYLQLREFFQNLRTSDEEQIVVAAAPAQGKH
jgi:hypothetical protein